jgi:hypothetical protein
MIEILQVVMGQAMAPIVSKGGAEDKTVLYMIVELTAMLAKIRMRGVEGAIMKLRPLILISIIVCKSTVTSITAIPDSNTTIEVSIASKGIPRMGQTCRSQEMTALNA